MRIYVLWCLYHWCLIIWSLHRRAVIKVAMHLLSGVLDGEWMRSCHWLGQCFVFPSVLWHCWMGDRKDIRLLITKQIHECDWEELAGTGSPGKWLETDMMNLVTALKHKIYLYFIFKLRIYTSGDDDTNLCALMFRLRKLHSILNSEKQKWKRLQIFLNVHWLA